MKSKNIADVGLRVNEIKNIDKVQDKVRENIRELSGDISGVELYDKKTHVKGYASFLHSMIHRDAFNIILAKKLNRKELDNIREICKKTYKITEKSLFKNSIYSDSNSTDFELKGKVGCTLYNSVGFTTLTYENNWKNKEIRSEIASRSIIYSVLTMHTNCCDIPNFTNICAAIIYYWAYSKVDIPKIESYFKNIKNWDSRVSDFEITEDTKFEEFAEYVFRENSGFVKEFIENSLNSYADVIMYDNIDKFVNVLIKCKKKNIHFKKLADHMEESFKYNIENNVSDIIFLLRKGGVSEYAAVLITTISFIDPLEINNNDYSMYSYEYKKYYSMYKNTKRIYSSKAMLLRECVRRFDLMQWSRNILNLLNILSYTDSTNQIMNDKLVTDNEALLRDLSRNREKLYGIRNKMRDEQKRANKLGDELSNANAKIRQLTKEVENVISPKDFTGIQADNAMLQSKVDELEDTNSTLVRQINKKDKEVDELKKKLADTEEALSDLNGKFDKSKEISEKMQVHRIFNEIPINTFVNAIRDKKIMLIGGNVMHSKIKEYGLDNIKLFEAGCRNITYEDIRSVDHVIVVTAYCDHSSIEYVTKAVREHGINIIHFNNKNVDMLIYKIFEETFRNKGDK